MKPKLLLPLAAAALVLGAPAAANAAITTQVAPGTLTITGNEADDNVILAVNAQGQLTNNFGAANGFSDNADFDATQAGSQPIVSGTVGVVANLGAGNDAINLSAADLNNSTLNGEAGDDIIVGSDNADTISGGDGNERITGFRGGDTINGDAGNDVMIWNNGDGTDSNTGGGGVDETQVNASQVTDGMTVKAAANGFRFDRVTAVTFGIDIVDVDRLAINGFGGNDSLATDPGVTLPMTIDAGSGDDAITTGDGADVINGGDGNDTLNGAGGGDRVIGDRGGDTFNAGEGDDTTVWNNGDGSDLMNGDNGVDRVEVNLSGADEVSTFKPENGRVRYDRITAVAFNLSIGTAEFFELNTLGGNDTLTASPGTGLPLVVDAGAGNDVLNVRDDVAGHFFGGSGTDTATIDATDTTVDVETATAPPVPPVLQPGAPALAKTAKVKRGSAGLKLSCPAGTTGCEGKVTLTYKGKRIGRAAYTLRAGEAKTIKVKVAKKPTRRKSLSVTAKVSSKAGPDQLHKVKLVL